MSFGGGSSGGGTQQRVDPYAPAQPALNQIIGEAGNLYNQGVAASGYVAPTTQTTQGIAQQELMANAANTQLSRYFSWKLFKSFFISNATRFSKFNCYCCKFRILSELEEHQDQCHEPTTNFIWYYTRSTYLMLLIPIR